MVWARYVQRVLPHPPACSRAGAPDEVFVLLAVVHDGSMLQTRMRLSPQGVSTKTHNYVSVLYTRKV
jgi:hypothetical protein